MDTLYQRFLETKQEPLRLSAALTGFFLDGVEEPQRQAYGAYLKRRIRPAAAALVETEDTDRLARLADLGWLDRPALEACIQTARERKKFAALVWLLRLKQAQFGFPDRDFSL